MRPNSSVYGDFSDFTHSLRVAGYSESPREMIGSMTATRFSIEFRSCFDRQSARYEVAPCPRGVGCLPAICIVSSGSPVQPLLLLFRMG